MPNQPKTPLHSFRIDDDLWDELRDRAEPDRAEVLRQLVAWYLRRPGARMPRRPSNDGRSSDGPE